MMSMDEGRYPGFVGAKIYAAVCVIYGLVCVVAIFRTTALESSRNPITLSVLAGMWFATASGIWLRKPWGLYLAGFTLLLFAAKGIAFMLMDAHAVVFEGGLISLVFAVLYGIYFFRRRALFEW